MPTVLVAIPVLNRPERVRPLLDSIDRTQVWGNGDLELAVIFLVSPGDHVEIEAIQDALLDWDDTSLYWVGWELVPFENGPGDYARKINYAAAEYEYDWLFQAADDLRFDPDWLIEAFQVIEQTQKTVIGTNDLGNPLVMRGQHAVHCLVRNDYIQQGTWDEPGKLLHEGYGHNWVDNELIATAKGRDQFAFARDSIVEHLHPIWRDQRGQPKGADDDTYRLGQRSYREDHALFNQRRRGLDPTFENYRRRYQR